MIRLTDIQRDTLAFIIETIAECGYPPTVREMCGRFGVTIQSVYDRVHALERKGAVSIEPGTARAIRVRGIRWQPVLTGEATQAAELVAGRAAS